MNLDRFDGYPDLQERRIKKPTVFERWQMVGFDPAEDVGRVFQSGDLNIASCIYLFEKGHFASSDATKGLSDRSGQLNSRNAALRLHYSFSLASCAQPFSTTGGGCASEPLETFGHSV